VGQAWTKTCKECQTRIRQISSVSYPSIEMQIPLSQLIMGAVRSMGEAGEDVHEGEILTHLPTCFLNGVRMGLPLSGFADLAGMTCHAQ